MARRRRENALGYMRSGFNFRGSVLPPVFPFIWSLVQTLQNEIQYLTEVTIRYRGVQNSKQFLPITSTIADDDKVYKCLMSV